MDDPHLGLCKKVSIPLAILTFLPGFAMSSDFQTRVNELVSIHSNSAPLRGSAVEFSYAMRVISTLYGEALGLSNQDLGILKEDASNKQNRDHMSRNVLRPFLIEIRRRLNEPGATEELAQLLMDAIQEEKKALDVHYRELYARLSADGKNRVDTARNNLNYENTISEIDFAGLAVEEPTVVHGILESATDRFFDPPNEVSTSRKMEVVRKGEN